MTYKSVVTLPQKLMTCPEQTTADLTSFATDATSANANSHGIVSTPHQSTFHLSLTPKQIYPLPPHPSSHHPTNMASVASKRLFHEYRTLTNDPPEGITAGPINEDDIFLWEALIQGPEGTPFEGGIFPAELKFPKDYPLAPPTMRFLGEIWHPNGTCSPPYCKRSLGGLC